MAHQPVLGELLPEERKDAVEEENAITLKTEWKRKGERVDFFTQGASNADFFDLVSQRLLLGRW